MLYSYGASLIACSLLASQVIPTSIDLNTAKEKEADRQAFNMSIGHLNRSNASFIVFSNDTLLNEKPVSKMRLILNKNYLFPLISAAFAYF